jgi:DNA-binding transcriptional MocR family regulator
MEILYETEPEPARGAPAPECLPVQELADCAKSAIEQDGVAILSYGAGGGYGPLREWIAWRDELSGR